MNIKANRFMALGASFLLCFVLGSARRCFTCQQVKPDNSCAHEMSTCGTGVGERCYTRRYSVGGLITQVQRGCTFFCHTKTDSYHYMKAETLCCWKHLCNTQDIWPEN